MGTYFMIFAFFFFDSSISSAIISLFPPSNFIRMTEVCKSIESITFYAYVTCRTCCIIKASRLMFTFVQRLCSFRMVIVDSVSESLVGIDRIDTFIKKISSLRKFTDYSYEIPRIYISICREAKF